MYSMLHFTNMVHMGIKGQVLNENGDLIPNATVKVQGNDKSVKTSRRGEYWKILSPGNYTLVCILMFGYVLPFSFRLPMQRDTITQILLKSTFQNR